MSEMQSTTQKMYKYLEQFCKEPELEVQNIKSSFEQYYSLSGRDTYKPKLILFDNFQNKKFGVSSREYVDQEDFFISISEMLYSYSAFNAGSCIMVLDSSTVKYQDSSGSLITYFASEDSAAVLHQEYRYVDDANIEWRTPDEEYKEIDIKTGDATNKIVEMLFVYTHLESAPFSPSELLSYYSMKNYSFRPFKDLQTSYLDYSFKD